MPQKSMQKQQLDLLHTCALLQGRVPVYGEGNINSPIIFIGEAPGGDEEKQGRPFVGKAGKNLNSFLDMINMPREEIYITNAVKFRPTKEKPKTKRLSNRTPTSAEILQFRQWLVDEVKLIQPKLVVTLGNSPLFSITGNKSLKITDCHGTLIDMADNDFGFGFKLMPFFHPAAVIYRRELITEYNKDLEKLKVIWDSISR